MIIKKKRKREKKRNEIIIWEKATLEETPKENGNLVMSERDVRRIRPSGSRQDINSLGGRRIDRCPNVFSKEFSRCHRPRHVGPSRPKNDTTPRRIAVYTPPHLPPPAYSLINFNSFIYPLDDSHMMIRLLIKS